MSINLVDEAKALFTHDLIVKATAFLGERETAVNKAIAGIVPSLLGGITEKVSSPGGAETVTTLATESASPAFLGNVTNLFDNDGGGFIGKGTGLLGNLFGEHKTGLLSNLISNFSGVKSSSVSSLLSMAAPLILGLLGRHATSNNLDANGLSTFLNSQKNNIANAIPAGLNLDSFLGSFSARAADTVSHASHAATHHVENVKTGGGGNILLPLIILALLGSAVWYFTKDGCSKKDETHGSTSPVHTDTMVENVSTTLSSSVGKLDSVTGGFYL